MTDSGFRSGCFPVNFTRPVTVPPASSTPPTLAQGFLSPSPAKTGLRSPAARTRAPWCCFIRCCTTLGSLQRRGCGTRRNLVRRHDLPDCAAGLLERVPHAVLAGRVGDIQIALLVLAARGEVQLRVQQL